jgi:hypothetical protein
LFLSTDGFLFAVASILSPFLLSLSPPSVFITLSLRLFTFLVRITLPPRPH